MPRTTTDQPFTTLRVDVIDLEGHESVGTIDHSMGPRPDGDPVLPGHHGEAIVHRHDERILVDEERDAPDTVLLEPSDTLLEREHVESFVGHGTITALPRMEPARIASYACGASWSENACTWARIFPASANADHFHQLRERSPVGAGDRYFVLR